MRQGPQYQGPRQGMPGDAQDAGGRIVALRQPVAQQTGPGRQKAGGGKYAGKGHNDCRHGLEFGIGWPQPYIGRLPETPENSCHADERNNAVQGPVPASAERGQQGGAQEGAGNQRMACEEDDQGKNKRQETVHCSTGEKNSGRMATPPIQGWTSGNRRYSANPPRIRKKPIPRQSIGCRP